MTREDTVHVLLGLFLITALAFPFVVGLLALKGLEVLAHRYLAYSLSQTDFLFAFCALGALVSCSRQLRKKQWSNAFLYFGMLLAFGSIFLTPQHSLRFGDLSFALVLCVAFTASGSRLARLEFVVSWFVVCAAILVNTGVLQSVLLAKLFGWLGQFAAFVIVFKQVRSEMKDNPTELPSSAS